MEKLKVGDRVRYRPVNSQVEGPGKAVADRLKPLYQNVEYVVREYDEQFEELYGYARVLLEGVENEHLPTVHGFMEIGYSSNKFLKV